MKTILYLNGKRTSQKLLKDLIGQERLERCIDDAKHTFWEDPLVQNDFMVPGGMLTICFE